ncbi:kinase-like domain-containing protein [Hysterangium stoloniferum]|nr:kinase-like domain-containing protein [Hysterangium stoloniferum]
MSRASMSTTKSCNPWNDRELSCEEHTARWNTLRAWFMNRGYKLYSTWEELGVPQNHVWYTCPADVYNGYTGFPYAHIGGADTANTELNSPDLAAPFWDQVAYAQDAQSRHVVIKFVKGGSDHYRVFRFLYDCKEEAESHCIVPILDFLKYDEDWFVVMPRWGRNPLMPWFSTVREVITFMHSVLRAVEFLHRNLIVHRDVACKNILINHFAGIFGNEAPGTRRILREQNKSLYALCDFDCSMMFSPTSKPEECRLPSDMSFQILALPFDTSQGELDYDPFTFEMLKHKQVHFFNQDSIPIVPLLAPLFDRMITSKLEERFTATEALAFLENLQSQLTPEQLNSEAPKVDHDCCVGPWDPDLSARWSELPADFVREWSSYRAPSPSLWTRILRMTVSFSWGFYANQAVRRFIRLIYRSWDFMLPPFTR